MHRYTTSQKNSISEFKNIAQCTEQTAVDHLSRHSWKLDSAINDYFTNKANKPAINEVRIKQLYDKYKDKEVKNRILLTGMQSFLNDINIDPSDILALVLAWKFRARVQGEFTEEEFFNGMRNIGCDSIDAIKKAIPSFHNDLSKRDTFKSIYMYSFSYANAECPDSKSLSIENAVPYWNLLLSGKYMHLELWFRFLKEKHRSPISRDTWNLFLDFIETIESDLSNYDEDGAWPVVLDQFVEFAKPIVGRVPDKYAENMDIS